MRILLLFLPLLPLFFYKLGQSSLTSYDEAWYGSIAKQIIQNGDLINLNWNGLDYIDHPFFGFWLIAAAIKLIGDNALAVRLPSAIFGFLSLLITYLLGKELFNKLVGFTSAIALSSSYWFLFRARSGNLDIPLTFFFLLTLFLAVKAVKIKKFILPWSISFALLLLTKTLVPITIIPSLIIIFWKKIKLKDLIKPLGFVTLIFLFWVITQQINNPNFLRRYFNIGLPGVSVETDYFHNLKLMKDYLYLGIGRWFWPSIVSLIFGIFLRERRFFMLSIFFLTFYIPFIFSEKGHIWHLIPLHPIMLLSLFGFLYVFLTKILKNKLAVTVIILGFCFSLSFIQIKRAWIEFIDIPAFISDEEILSREAGKYPEKFYIDGEFMPSANFYSNKEVRQIRAEGLIPLFEKGEPFILITYQWRLDKEKIEKEKYEIIKSDRDKILIKKF